MVILLMVPTLLMASMASARNLPNGYMQEGDVCRIEDGKEWLCRRVEDCRSRFDEDALLMPCTMDSNSPLVCCWANNSRIVSHPGRRPGNIANKYCEKYMEGCGGVIGGKLTEVIYTPHVVLAAAGGQPAPGRSQPHMALIGYGASKEWKCGGSLISERFVLTAAHCVPQNVEAHPQWVRLGELDYSRSDDDARPEDFSITRIFVNPEYRSPSMYHDIALLELDREVTFNPWIAPICLHTQPTVPFSSATASGWGRTGPVSPVSSQLMVINIDLVSKNRCQALTKSSSKIPRGVSEGMLCAGDKTGVQDTCQGDSGGPLYMYMSNRCLPSQIGITSFGALCTRPDSPGIYTKVYHYLHWIESIVWPN